MLNETGVVNIIQNRNFATVTIYTFSRRIGFRSTSNLAAMGSQSIELAAHAVGLHAAGSSTTGPFSRF
jgi:hypothetical protein